MTDMIARTLCTFPMVYVGDDGQTVVSADLRPTTQYPVDIAIREDVPITTLAMVSLTVAKARELRDNLTAVLIDLEVATIVAAGLADEVTA